LDVYLVSISVCVGSGGGLLVSVCVRVLWLTAVVLNWFSFQLLILHWT